MVVSLAKCRQFKEALQTFEEAVERFGRMLAPGEVDLTVHLGSELPVAHDRDALGRVVLNLLVNAMDAVARRQPRRIAITLERSPDTLSLCVTDNGHGLPPDLLDPASEQALPGSGSLRPGDFNRVLAAAKSMPVCWRQRCWIGCMRRPKPELIRENSSGDRRNALRRLLPSGV